jgi:hypothetical protein
VLAARVLLLPALERPDARADPALFGAALETAAGAAIFTDPVAGRRLAEQAVQVARRLGDDRLLTGALTEACFSCVFAGEPETGLTFGKEAIERARRLGDDVLLAETLAAHLAGAGPALSPQLVGEAIACTERSGDLLTNYYLHNIAGWDALSTGDVPAARSHLEAAARAGQAIGLPDTTTTISLGMVLRAEGDQDGAQSMLKAALRVSRRIGDSADIAGACLILACLAGDAGDWSRAATLHGAAQAVQGRTRVPWNELETRRCQDSLAQTRARFGDKQMDQAYAYGMTLSLDQTLELALSGASSA